MGEALAAGAQVYITGDISHHEGIDAVAQGMAVIDAGHYGIEHIFTEFMEKYLMRKLGDAVKVVREKPGVSNPDCLGRGLHAGGTDWE